MRLQQSRMKARAASKRSPPSWKVLAPPWEPRDWRYRRLLRREGQSTCQLARPSNHRRPVMNCEYKTNVHNGEWTHQYLPNNAVILSLNIDGGLVGLLLYRKVERNAMCLVHGSPNTRLMIESTHDFQEHITGSKRFALFLLPLCNAALGHRWRHCRHLHIRDGPANGGLVQACSL